MTNMRIIIGRDAPTASVVLHEFTPSVERKFNELPDEWLLSCVAHSVTFMDGIHYAIDRYCTIQGRRILRGTHHKIEFPGNNHSFELDDMICKFIHFLQKSFRSDVKQMYRLRVSGHHDMNGRVSYVTVLMAVFKLISGFDRNIDDYDCINRIDGFLDEENTDMGSRIAAIQAAKRGSYAQMHIVPEDKNAKAANMVKSTQFYFNMELVFITTDLHQGKVKDTTRIDQNVMNATIELFTTRRGIDQVPKEMMHHSANRFEDKKKYNAEIEMESHEALASFMENMEIGKTILGFESQSGGILVATKKDVFYQDTFIRGFCEFIAYYSSSQIERVTYELLRPGGGAHIVADRNLREALQKSNRTIVYLNYRGSKPSKNDAILKSESLDHDEPLKKVPRIEE